MKILITAGASERSVTLAAHLAQSHEVRLTERAHVEIPTDGDRFLAHLVSTKQCEFVQCALGHDGSTNLLTRGMNAIIHAVEPLPGEDASAQLDAADPLHIQSAVCRGRGGCVASRAAEHAGADGRLSRRLSGQ